MRIKIDNEIIHRASIHAHNLLLEGKNEIADDIFALVNEAINMEYKFLQLQYFESIGNDEKK